jgi:hypothetical protein
MQAEGLWGISPGGNAQAVGGEEVEKAVQAAEKDCDRALLKLYQAALKGGKLARGLEAASQLALPAALAGALALANRLGCAPMTCRRDCVT